MSLNNIFENTKFGFLSINNNKIKHINSFLRKSFKKMRLSCDISENLVKNF
jgi:hypothetical protein